MWAKVYRHDGRWRNDHNCGNGDHENSVVFDMNFFLKLRDMHQNISWNLGFKQGKEGLQHKCPWWVDRMVFSLAYLQAKGVEIPDVGDK